MERKKVNYGIHHQAIVDCPECGFAHIEDLGEDDLAEGITIDCECSCKFELSEVED